MNEQKYIVMVDDNFHFMDSSERYKASEHSTYHEAVAKCEAIVDEYLKSAIEPDMTAEELFSSYAMFGEDPFIVGEADQEFSAWNYAKEMSGRLAVDGSLKSKKC